MADPLETGQLFRVDMDYVAGALSLVVPHRTFGLQIPEQAQPQGVDYTPDRREGRLDSRGDPPVPPHRHYESAPATCKHCAG